MKSFIRLFSFVFLLCSVTLVFALPQGSYIKTCQSCSVNNSTLFCSCLDKNQNTIFSSLSNVGMCAYVVNNNGRLYCAHQITGPLPPGSYMHTCTSCQYDGNQLSCQCLNKNQFWRSTSLFGAGGCRWIINFNGHLICKRRYAPPYYESGQTPNVPYYQSGQTPNNPYQSGQVPNNQYQSGQTPNNQSQTGQTPNGPYRPGSLHTSSLPTGSFLQSCHTCSFDGNLLSCNCQRADGSWGASSLMVNQCSYVANSNGRLVCNGN